MADFQNYSVQRGDPAQVNTPTWEIEAKLVEGSTVLADYTQDSRITLPMSASADYDCNFVARNCLSFCANSAYVAIASGASTYMGGGLDVVGCTYIGAASILQTAANISTTYPCTVDGCLVYTGGTALNANGPGQIAETGPNALIAGTSRSNVTAHANDEVLPKVAAMIELGQSWLDGFHPRPFGAPMPGSPLLGWAPAVAVPAVDLLNRPRPAGGGTANANTDTGTATAGANSSLTDSTKSWTTNAYSGQMLHLTGGTGSGQYRKILSNTATALTIEATWATNPSTDTTYEIVNPGTLYALGAMERHETAQKETTTVDASPGIKILGPGDQEITVLVDAEATTLSIKARYDSAHAATNKPQAILQANAEIGVSAETLTMSEAADTWETLTFTQFTPTAKGAVKIRLVSRAAAGNGSAFFDTLAKA